MSRLTERMKRKSSGLLFASGTRERAGHRIVIMRVGNGSRTSLTWMMGTQARSSAWRRPLVRHLGRRILTGRAARMLQRCASRTADSSILRRLTCRELTRLNRDVEAFVHYISPTPEEDEIRSLIVAQISRAVKGKFPDAQVLPFGSYETKLYLPTGYVSPLGCLRNSYLTITKGY